MPYQVYFSDTSDELDQVRPVLVEQIRKNGMIPLWLDAEERKRPDMLDIVKQRITSADYFISIVTYKRAWEPPAMDGKSLAEIEFDLAHGAGKRSAVLLPKAASKMGIRLRRRAVGQPAVERNAQQRLWKKVEETGQAVYFSDEADLTQQITQVLESWASDQDTGGAVAVAEAVEAPIFPNSDVTIDEFAARVAEKTAEKVHEIQQQKQEELAEQTLKYNEALRLLPGELVFGRPANRSQFKCDVFMIMPFSKEFDELYHNTIRPLVNEVPLVILRGDEFTSTRGIVMEEVWAALNQCRFVIAEITGGNDNVFYELGIAHTLNKPAILITQAKEPLDVAFDIRHLRYIQYRNNTAGLKALAEELKVSITRLITDLEEGWGS